MIVICNQHQKINLVKGYSESYDIECKEINYKDLPELNNLVFIRNDDDSLQCVSKGEYGNYIIYINVNNNDNVVKKWCRIAQQGTYDLYNCIFPAVMQNDIPELVDLKLPSGTLWATENLCDDKVFVFTGLLGNTINAQTTGLRLGSPRQSLYNSINDKPSSVIDIDDAANYNLGEHWYIPTIEMVQELIDNTNVDNYTNTAITLSSKVDPSKTITLNGFSWDGYYNSNTMAIMINKLYGDGDSMCNNQIATMTIRNGALIIEMDGNLDHMNESSDNALPIRPVYVP